MPIEFAKISTQHFELLPKSQTVFFFPVGPLEDHGPHLPMGLDLEEADRFCHLMAKRLEAEMPDWVGVIMPRAPLGIDSNTTRHAICVRPHVLRDWLVDACVSLSREGFFHFVCASGHLGPRQLTAIEDAGSIIAGLSRWNWITRFSRVQPKLRPTLISVSSIFLTPKECLKSPFWSDPAEHGGEQDTSVALALAEGQVDAMYVGLPEQWKEGSWLIRSINRYSKKVQSYWGNPSQASAQKGEALLLERLELVFPKLRAVWSGAEPKFIFKSWYSIFPNNKSFFKAWVIAIVLMIVLAFWFYFNQLRFEF